MSASDVTPASELRRAAKPSIVDDDCGVQSGMRGRRKG